MQCDSSDVPQGMYDSPAAAALCGLRDVRHCQ
jgi:hypothetical protein